MKMDATAGDLLLQASCISCETTSVFLTSACPDTSGAYYSV